MQDEWQRFIHRDCAWKLARVFICASHFRDEDMLLYFDIPQGDGIVKKVSRKPGLRKMPSPSIFLTVLHI